MTNHLTKETAIILGVGAERGLGAALARRFAADGYHVILAGRTADKLAARVQEIEAQGGAATAVVTDVTNTGSVDGLFTKAAATGPIAAVLYNAGNNARIPFQDISAEQFERFWRVCCFGGFLTAQAAIAHMLPRQRGSLFFTGASGSLRGRANFAHFASAKAGLRNLAQSLAREFGPQGLHIAHFIIDGVIDGQMIRERFPEFVEQMGADGALNPDAIAQTVFHIHQQHPSAWSHEVDLRPFKENW